VKSACSLHAVYDNRRWPYRDRFRDVLINVSRFWGVFWIDVSTTDVAERSLLEVAQRLSIPTQTWEDARLGIANLKHSWLLVLDNADNPAVDYQDYFPGGTLGVVLLTSRNEECQQYATAKSISLKGLYDGEARDLLLKAARVPLDQYSMLEGDAKMTAGLLQSHPLALVQAGAYVSRGHCTLAEYPRMYERQRRRLLTFRPTQAQSRYRDVYATFEVSAAFLRNSRTEATRDALQLLPLLAVCGPSRLPLSLFEAGWKGAKRVPPDVGDNDKDDQVSLLTPWHVAHIPLLLNAAGDAWDPFRLVEAVSLLKTFSLVSTDSHDASLSVSMHPLVHAWARDRQDDGEQHQHWLQMGCVIALARSEEVLWQGRGRQLQSHIEALIAWEISTMLGAEPLMLVTRVLVNCGWVLSGMRADAKLFIFMKRIFTHLGLNWAVVELPWMGVYDLAARNLHDHGKIKEAVALLEEVVKIKEQSLAEDHPSRLASQRALAGAYKTNGQVKEAVALLEEVMKIQEQSLAEDHPSRLASQHNWAIYMWELGSQSPALEIMMRVVKIRRRMLNKTHPDRQSSEAWLAEFETEIASSKHKPFSSKWKAASALSIFRQLRSAVLAPRERKHTIRP
jgi:Tetratricopeptide repeat